MFGESVAARSSRWLILVVISVATAAIGTGRALPLDRHDVYVARTAEEMIERGDWLVPWFNGEPRLRKPPLSHWLVIASDALIDNDGIISEFEARLPSIAGGVLLTILTALLGSVLVDRPSGFVAGLLVASSSGYITYTHSPRPEMVYAVLCTGGLLGFAIAETAFSRSRRRSTLAAWVGWAAFGLATMAKGPQLPLIIIIGWIAGSAWQMPRRPTLRAIRPFSGGSILLLISAWWFLAILASVPDAVEIWRHETIDRYIESDDAPWWLWLDPYYVYRPAGLVLPWVPFYALALLTPWNKSLKHHEWVRRLWWIVLTAMVVLSLSFGRRWYYMLPILGPLTVLMAAAAVNLARQVWRQASPRAWGAFAGAHVAAAAAGAVYLVHERVSSGEERGLVMTLIIAIAIAALIMLLVGDLLRRLGFLSSMAMTCVAVALLLTSVEATGSLWRDNRFQHREFSSQISDDVEQAPVVGWVDNWAEEQFYLHRRIPRLDDPVELRRCVEQHGPVWVLVDVTDRPLSLPGDLEVKVVYRADFDGRKDRLQLWRVTGTSTSRHRRHVSNAGKPSPRPARFRLTTSAARRPAPRPTVQCGPGTGP